MNKAELFLPWPDKRCSVADCLSTPLAVGLCNAHYKRLKRHGSPTGGRTPVGTALLFLDGVIRSQWPKECVDWPFTCDRNGYARIHYNGTTSVTARVVCERVNGPPPTPAHEAAHSCGNGHLGCINPGHLRWATRPENFADKLLHGTDARGEKSPTAKLSAENVEHIKASAGKIKGRDLARLYDVSPATICNIQKGHTWAWL